MSKYESTPSAPLGPKPSYGVAVTKADRATPLQLVAIRSIASAIDSTGEAQCHEQFNCRPDDLSGSAAIWLIDFLKKKSIERWRASQRRDRH